MLSLVNSSVYMRIPEQGFNVALLLVKEFHVQVNIAEMEKNFPNSELGCCLVFTPVT